MWKELMLSARSRSLFDWRLSLPELDIDIFRERYLDPAPGEVGQVLCPTKADCPETECSCRNIRISPWGLSLAVSTDLAFHQSKRRGRIYPAFPCRMPDFMPISAKLSAWSIPASIWTTGSSGSLVYLKSARRSEYRYTYRICKHSHIWMQKYGCSSHQRHRRSLSLYLTCL